MPSSILDVPNIPLRCKASIPAVGFGTWQISPADVPRAVCAALDAGYRHLDLAYIYLNQKEIGSTLKDWLSRNPHVSRSDLFITSKLWMTEYRPERVLPALRCTLADLKLDYLDLYLLHWPFPLDPLNPTLRDSDPPTIASTWAALAAAAATPVDCPAYHGPLVKSIGVCNFNIACLRLLSNPIPEVHQVEMHPLLPQCALLEYCRSQGIVVTAYCPLGSTNSPLHEDPTLLRLCAKHGTDSPAQILLSWGVRRNTVVIPKSANPDRIKNNVARYVQLDDDDMWLLDNLPTVSGIGERRFCSSIDFWGFNVHADDFMCI